MANVAATKAPALLFRFHSAGSVHAVSVPYPYDSELSSKTYYAYLLHVPTRTYYVSTYVSNNYDTIREISLAYARADAEPEEIGRVPVPPAPRPGDPGNAKTRSLKISIGSLVELDVSFRLYSPKTNPRFGVYHVTVDLCHAALGELPGVVAAKRAREEEERAERRRVAKANIEGFRERYQDLFDRLSRAMAKKAEMDPELEAQMDRADSGEPCDPTARLWQAFREVCDDIRESPALDFSF